MKTFQERTIARIDAVATEHEWETSIAFDYANTGSIFLHEPGKQRPRVAIGFDFQGSAYKLTITFDGRKIPSQRTTSTFIRTSPTLRGFGTYSIRCSAPSRQ